jgi:hypothetical protein
VTDAEAIRRFVLVAATLDPAVADWTAAAVWRGLSASRRRRIRDDLLREAAGLLSPASAWQKAHALAEFARSTRARPDASTVPGLVALALRVYPGRGGLSAGQAFRVVVSRMSPHEMEAEAVEASNSLLDCFPLPKVNEHE